MGGEKNKSKRKEKKTIKDWGSMVSFKYCSCKNVKEEETHTSSWEGGREGGQSQKKFWKTCSLNLPQLMMISNSSLFALKICSQLLMELNLFASTLILSPD
jgi:hypothetical protein